uniref:Out at first protein n=1 Tax=Strigamia maritima TaxID=126957 RepID=T1JC08_STRMM
MMYLDTQIFRAVVLGEEERGQSQYQVMCFVASLTKNEFISSDAMSKLRQDTQIFRAVVLGEEERGQSQYQVMCFVASLTKNEFISSDAMSKLRQKNPGTIRQPEENKGKDQMSMELLIDLEKSSVISHHIRNMCAEANDAIYARESDLDSWAKGINRDLTSLTSAVKRFPPITAGRCKDVGESWKACTCRLEVCVGWYPCGLKYCKGKDSTGRSLSYRCGIKTCKRCRIFDYFVTHKQICLWDE